MLIRCEICANAHQSHRWLKIEKWTTTTPLPAAHPPFRCPPRCVRTPLAANVKWKRKGRKKMRAASTSFEWVLARRPFWAAQAQAQRRERTASEHDRKREREEEREHAARECERERERESAQAKAFQWAFQARCMKKRGNLWAQNASECVRVCVRVCTSECVYFWVCVCFWFCVCVCVLSRQMIEGVAWQKWQTMLKALTTEAVHAHTAQERARGWTKEKEREEKRHKGRECTTGGVVECVCGGKRVRKFTRTPKNKMVVQAEARQGSSRASAKGGGEWWQTSCNLSVAC